MYMRNTEQVGRGTASASTISQRHLVPQYEECEAMPSYVFFVSVQLKIIIFEFGQRRYCVLIILML